MYVEGLASAVNERELREYFSGCGTILEVRIKRDKYGISFRNGVVIFEQPESLPNAIDMNGSELRDLRITVTTLSLIHI